MSESASIESPLESGTHPEAATAVAAGTDDYDFIAARRLSAIASPRFAVPIILATGALLYLANLGGYPLYTKGEPREAVTVFDIVHGGGVILPMRAGVEIPSKPLLMHWFAALISLVAGQVNEWTVRLPSAMLAIAGMLICYLYIRRFFEQRGALFAAIILGTAFQYLQAGTDSRVDMTLTFFMEVAFFEFLMIAEGLTGRVNIFYLALALAVLTKGPVGIVLPALVAAIWILIWRRWDLLRRLKLGRGALIVGILGGGWYLAAIAVGGQAFIHKQILGENFYRLFHHRGFHEGHGHPFYYEEGALIAAFMPWSPVAAAAVAQWLRRPRRLDPRFSYLLVWFLTVLIFYNLPQSKRGVYLLALYPALSTIVALFISDAISQRESIAGWVRWLSRGAGVFFITAGIGALIALMLLHLYPASILWALSQFGILLPPLIGGLKAAAREHFILTLLIPVAATAIGLGLLVTLPLAEKMLFGIATGFACIALAVNLVTEPAVANTLTLKGFARQTAAIVGTNRLGYYGNIDYDFAFYIGRDIDFVQLDDSTAPQYIVSSEDSYRQQPLTVRSRFAVVLHSGPTDFENTGQMVLLRRISPRALSPSG
jgi:4-amino-4-deoxy-L-arabinose transferase-like glycosyltransferase